MSRKQGNQTLPFAFQRMYSFGPPEVCVALLEVGDGYFCVEHMTGLGYLSMFTLKKKDLPSLQFKPIDQTVGEALTALKAKGIARGATLEAIQLLGTAVPLTKEEESVMAEAGTATKLSRKSANKEELKAAAKAAPVATKAPKAPKAVKEAAPKAPPTGGGRKSAFDDSAKVKVVKPKENPYREGSKAYATFELFKEHGTVGAIREAATEDHDLGYLRYASRDGHITIG